MGKVCLLFVLSIVSIFPIFAQTKLKAAVNFEPIKNELASTEASETESAVERDETESLDFQKTALSVITNTDLASDTIKELRSFSTGNATIDSYILAACAKYDVDPILIYAQMSQESSFRINATSHKGASGLMQLMPDTARRFGVTNIYSPKQNIEAGVKYMRWLLDEFDGDIKLALAGYNAGEGAVRKYNNQIPPYRETRNYVAKITAHYEKIKQ